MSSRVNGTARVSEGIGSSEEMVLKSYLATDGWKVVETPVPNDTTMEVPDPEGSPTDPNLLLSTLTANTTGEKIRRDLYKLDAFHPKIGVEVDMETNLVLPYSEILIPTADAPTAGEAVQSNGTFIDVRPFNDLWSIKTTRKAIASGYSRTWNDVINWSFPAVLLQFAVGAVNTVGGALYKACYNYEMQDAYSGPIPVTMTEEWFATAPAAVSPLIFRPQGFRWDGVTTSGSVPACLHGVIVFSESGGYTSATTDDDNDPYLYANSWSFAATSPATLPSSGIIAVNTVPWKGGFKRITITATAIPGGV